MKGGSLMDKDEILAQRLGVDPQVLWNAHGTYRDHVVPTYGAPPISWEAWIESPRTIAE